MSLFAIFLKPMKTAAGVVVETFFLLMEDSSRVLQEDGAKLILE